MYSNYGIHNNIRWLNPIRCMVSFRLYTNIYIGIQGSTMYNHPEVVVTYYINQHLYFPCRQLQACQGTSTILNFYREDIVQGFTFHKGVCAPIFRNYRHLINEHHPAYSTRYIKFFGKLSAKCYEQFFRKNLPKIFEGEFINIKTF